MICKGCRQGIEEEAMDKKSHLCLSCFEVKIANEYAQEIIPFLLKHSIEFKRIGFGDGSGFYLQLEGGVNINFYHAGLVNFDIEGEEE